MRVYYKGAFACIYVVYSILRGHGDIRRLRGHRNMVWFMYCRGIKGIGPPKYLFSRFIRIVK